MRVVLDPNVLVSAIIGSGPPAQILETWSHGNVDLVASESLLEELADVLARPKLAPHVSTEEANAFVALLRDESILVDDPNDPPRRSRDPDDDYLVALAATTGALLVSGDLDLLDLAPELPVMSPREFLELLG